VCGVAAQQVELVAWLPSTVAHLALYHQVDIALDPFPYNGTTTTCEALWMGVPVVTLRGDRHSRRVGASLLSQIGQTDWIAGSLEGYLQIAATLAGDPAHLKDLRHSLRSRIVASPLCDATAFARKRGCLSYYVGEMGATQPGRYFPSWMIAQWILPSSLSALPRLEWTLA
jgi:protein O-GlcNAc transferase